MLYILHAEVNKFSVAGFRLRVGEGRRGDDGVDAGGEKSSGGPDQRATSSRGEQEGKQSVG